MFKRLPILIATVTALGLLVGLLAACGNDGSDREGSNMMSDMSMGHDMDMSGRDNSPSTRPPAEGAREIQVVARSFAFEPSEIEAKVGEELAVSLTSADITHDFVIDELGVHVQADKDAGETGGVRADTAGSYTYYCSVPGHRTAGMEGTLTVA
ncbi:MAG: cupredoxin domain-containing protein [Actinobacteria bacterium]|nr:cupredoxin domain-containing protein [Actinomycetota bacterium]